MAIRSHYAVLAALLWIVLVHQTLLVHGQGCFTLLDCGGDLIDISPPVTLSSCCLTPGAFSFQASAGGACSECQVYGWEVAEVTLEETGFSVDVGLILQGPPIPTVVVRFTVSNEEVTATRAEDYRPPPSDTTFFTSGAVPITANGDQVSQEGTESFILRLTIFGPQPPPSYLFRDELRVFITDRTEVEIGFNEEDFVVNEGDEILVTRIYPEATIASAVTLLITPLTYDEAVAMGVHRPTSPVFAATASDFIRDTVTVTIPAGTSAGAETVVMLPVVDDLVNEEDEEGFVALISVVSAVDPSLVVLRDSRSTVGRIIDNDIPQFSFVQERYDFPEEDSDRLITIRKEIQSDVDLSIFVIETPLAITAVEAATRGSDFEFSRVQVDFAPTLSEVDVSVMILDDSEFENDEGFSLRIMEQIGLLEGTIPVTTVVITDDGALTAAVVVGFEMTSYAVGEADGSVELCMTVTFPPAAQNLDGSIFQLTVSTHTDTADSADFSTQSPTFLTSHFNVNSARRICFDIVIEDDIILETDEMFTVELGLPAGQSLNSRITIDPDLAEVIIQDNDGLIIGFEQEVYVTSEPEFGVFLSVEICAVVRAGTIATELAVVPFWRAGTATEGPRYKGGDYTPPLGDYTFSASQQRSCLDFYVFGDERYEITESAFGALIGIWEGDQLVAAPAGIILDPSLTTINIQDNDGPGKE